MLTLPNIAFGLLVAGILIAYGEFIWVGKLVFGVVGAVLALIGITLLAGLPHSWTGISLLAAAVGCFAVEAVFKAHWVAGMTGTALLGWGSWKLCRPPKSIAPLMAFPASLILGGVTTALLSVARRARENKRLDLQR